MPTVHVRQLVTHQSDHQRDKPEVDVFNGESFVTHTVDLSRIWLGV